MSAESARDQLTLQNGAKEQVQCAWKRKQQRIGRKLGKVQGHVTSTTKLHQPSLDHGKRETRIG